MASCHFWRATQAITPLYLPHYGALSPLFAPFLRPHMLSLLDPVNRAMFGVRRWLSSMEAFMLVPAKDATRTQSPVLHILPQPNLLNIVIHCG